MKLNINFLELEQAVASLASLRPFPKLEISYKFEPLDQELEDGIEIPASEVTIQEGLLSYKGRQVVLYIKDHTTRLEATLESSSKGYKFHFSHCKALQDMHTKGRYKRYVARNGISRSFTIGSANQPNKNYFANLWVCQFCLTKINYKNSVLNAGQRRENAENFNLKEFFSIYSSIFEYPAQSTIEQKVGYAKNWKSISKKVRNSYGYQCQKCQVNLIEHQYLCHTHHINGVKSDNDLSNLVALCADCHRKAHEGFIYVEHQQMQIITQLRKEQGILANINWEQALQLIDPALKGGIQLLQQKGFSPPHIGYSVNSPVARADTEELILEAAWPDRKLGITLMNKDKASSLAPDWEIWSFQDLLE